MHDIDWNWSRNRIQFIHDVFSLRTQSTHEATELSGMAQSFGYLLAAIGPVLFGLLHDITHSWTVPLLMLAAISALIFIVGMRAGNNEYVTTQ